MKCPNCNVRLVAETIDLKEGTLVKLRLKPKPEPKLTEVSVKEASLGYYVVKGEGTDSWYLGTDLKFHKTMMYPSTPYFSEAYAKRLVKGLHEKEKKEQS